MKKFLTQRNIYICLFALLYIATALVSTIHAVSFFCLANVMALGILLAVTFEIGQAATLFSILTSKKDRSKAMPWILMFILTGVQILGNVFSSYRYLITNSADQLRFFKEPIFVWMELPDAQANVILTYIIGAVLPIVALALTGMLTNYLEDDKKENNEVESQIVEKEVIKEVDNPEQAKEIERLKAELETEQNKPTPAPEIVEKEVIKEVDNPEQAKEIERLKTELEEANNKPTPEPQIIEKEVIKEVDNPEQAKEIERLKAELEAEKNKPTPAPQIIEKEVIKEVPMKTAPKTIEEKQADELIDNATKSHFINLK